MAAPVEVMVEWFSVQDTSLGVISILADTTRAGLRYKN